MPQIVSDSFSDYCVYRKKMKLFSSHMGSDMIANSFLQPEELFSVHKFKFVSNQFGALSQMGNVAH